jgi:putative molybdopterin biosynthesis protein
VEGTPVIGIPGYPVAAAVAFERFARPLLERLLGALPGDAPLIRVRLIGEVRAKRGVEAYVPLILSDGHDLPNALPQSRKGGALRGLAGAHALLCTQLEDGVLPAGSEVDARLLRPWPRG